MWFALYERPEGAKTEAGRRVVYDLERNEAHFGAARVNGPALVWEVAPSEPSGADLSLRFDLDLEAEWLLRCDRIDFPPGGVAHRHTHPGPGIRRLLFGSILIEGPEGFTRSIAPGGAWFEGADYPVVATASEAEETAFVRVLLLPREWEGKRTIRYLDPADEDKPKLQRATVFFDRPIEL